MARLPDNRYLIQNIGGEFILLFEDGTEREVLRIKLDDDFADNFAKAQKKIYELEDMSDEDKAFAHFWSGYFYAYHIYTSGR